jgi:hypothetical protein
MADLLMKMPIPYEPKRENRWILRFPSSLGINEWYVETFARPKLTIGATEIQFLNTSTFVAGRFKWEPLSVKFRDPIGPSASQATPPGFPALCCLPCRIYGAPAPT